MNNYFELKKIGGLLNIGCGMFVSDASVIYHLMRLCVWLIGFYFGMKKQNKITLIFIIQ